MTVEDVDVTKAVERVKVMLEEQKDLPPAFRTSIELLILEDETGKRYVAQFPEHVTKAIQYGGGVKAESVYLSMFQLVPLARVQDQFFDQMGLPLSKGSVLNWNQEAYERLAPFETWAKQQLLASLLNHADETGINVGGTKIWLHNLSNEKITLKKKYRKILKRGEKECPKPPPKEVGKRGKQKKDFSRNLLERLCNFEADTLRFMSQAIVPFTNNQGENDLRMTKVQQKISGCFRSMDGAKIFCRIRAFLSTCRKNQVSPAEALRDLFQGKFPAFMT